MDYKLAKELKEAGFPQNYSKDAMYFLNEEMMARRDALGGLMYTTGDRKDYVIDFAVELVYIPTLSELIEACGEEFLSLEIVGDRRGAWYYRATDTTLHSDDGTTPEEAVARLYLALNKK